MVDVIPAAKNLSRRGIMVVLSSPSGAGKTTIARMLVARDENLAPSISVTTRAQRPGEVAGRDYLFIEKEKFNNLVQQGELLEYAEVFGNFYGTPKQPVFEALANGQDLMFDIDWQGARQLTENAREDLVTIFVLPPTIDELERRLRARAQDSDDVIRFRMSKAPSEMSHYPEYDYVIINFDVDDSVRKIQTIIDAERLKRRRQVGLVQFVHDLSSLVEEATKL